MQRLRSVFAGMLSVVLTVAMIFGFGASQAVAAENGVATTTSSSTHNAIVLVLDNSGSMYGEPIERLKTATKQFVSKVLAKDPQSQISLVSFSNDTTVQDFTNDKTTLNNFADKNLFGDSGTDVTAGLQKADEVLKNFKDTASVKYARSIVTMSDGWPNSAESATNQAKSMFPSYNMYSVGFYPYEDNSASTFMKSIQNKGYFEANDLDALIQKFDEIADVILNPPVVNVSHAYNHASESGGFPWNGMWINVRVSNPGSKPLSNVQVKLKLDKYMWLAGDAAEQKITDIPAKSDKTVKWLVFFKSDTAAHVKTQTPSVIVSGDRFISVTASDRISTIWVTKTTIFTFGVDNWSFPNPTDWKLSDKDLDALKHSGLSDTDYQTLKATSEKYAKDGGTNGNCAGMAITEILAKVGYDFPDVSAKNLHSVPKNDEVISYINYYALGQFTYASLSRMTNTTNLPEKNKISQLKQKLATGNVPVLLGIRYIDKKNNGKGNWGHMVVADQYDIGSYKIDDKEYNLRVRIIDNNTPDQQKAYLYANTQTGHWKLKNSQDEDKEEGNTENGQTTIGYISNVVEEMTPFNHQTASSNYQAWLSASNQTFWHNLKVSIQATGKTITWPAHQLMSDPRFTVIPSFNGSTDSSSTVSLPATQPYTITSSGESDYAMRYPNIYLNAQADKATSTTFNPNASVSVNGSKGSYRLLSTVDKGTPWSAFAVSGNNGGNVSLNRIANGDYVVRADNLKNVSITAENRNETKSITVSTDAHKIGIKAQGNNLVAAIDKDNNGSFETVIASSDGSQNGSNGGQHGNNGGTPTAPNSGNGGPSASANGSHANAATNAGSKNSVTTKTADANNGPQKLSRTGVAIVAIAAAAGVLLAGGVIILVARRRREE
ncbi:vWA domain-containing protein [Bifidobacterium simiarum]|nr:vWA domain-containing protein [Bifidobacterium simiarum]